MERRVGPVVLEFVIGDITQQKDMEAVVNAANAELLPGGGVAGAIHRSAGPKLEEACRPLAPIRPGEAVMTDAFKLPNKKIIHCLGPIYGMDEPADRLLAACYRNALRLADQKGLESVAFPAISTGAFGYPLEEAAQVGPNWWLLRDRSLCRIRGGQWPSIGKSAGGCMWIAVPGRWSTIASRGKCGDRPNRFYRWLAWSPWSFWLSHPWGSVVSSNLKHRDGLLSPSKGRISPTEKGDQWVECPATKPENLALSS